MSSLVRIGGMAAVWLAAVAAWPQAVPAGKAYRISGVMVHGVTGKPLSQAHVFVAPDDGSSKPLETTTGADGGFTFDGLPAGSWTLTGEARGLLRQNYGEHAVYGAWASSVVTGPGGASENLTFPLNPPAAIRGKVVDENGEPVPYAHLQWLVQVPGPRKQFLVRKVAGTDDLGEYRLAGLPAVECYLLAVVPIPTAGGSEEMSGLAPQYYPNVTDPRAAVPIQLKAGEDFTADFTLRRSHSVSVVVQGSSGIAGNSSLRLLCYR